VLRILNGCGVSGVCHRMADQCQQQGWQIRSEDITNAPQFNFAKTIIKTNSAHRIWAVHLAEILGLPEDAIQEIPNTVVYPTVTLVVGKDYALWMK
jgi:hypothetical protein